MTTHEFSIRPTTPSDWREVRDIRLAMIRDTPTAYAESLDDALRVDEAEWRRRGGRGTGDQQIQVAATDGAGQWVGTMGGYVPDSVTGPLLVGVFVAPEWRGRHIRLTDALLETVEAWARTEGGRLTLHVHEDNARARRYYERTGFTATGHTIPYNLGTAKNELEMLKSL
ncbi:acetyltransferase [Arthrobacter sp. PAMC 25486]|uniref:GNAT family N-acetyltransferase n=1 Tax=Arthrobacter sp. PAMC 25486 TaxID=1494608 RepID=UPI000536309D|nr:GNAT family N-acetyltransferase [Arthrobacter sp. PAMC 25486]AIY00193.1 acetyltransferase [Arthrobacter sp. PAMC 25486]